MLSYKYNQTTLNNSQEIHKTYNFNVKSCIFLKQNVAIYTKYAYNKYIKKIVSSLTKVVLTFYFKKMYNL